MSARPLACRTDGCPGVLGWVRDGVLTVSPRVGVACLLGSGRCTVTCPACGRPTDWRGAALVVRERKPAAA